MRVFSKRNPALILLCFLFAILIPLAEGCGGPGPQNPSEETSPDVSETNESESESSEETAVYSVNYSGTSYPLSAVNRDTGGQGLFYFDRSTGATSAPEREPEADPYTDIAVCNGIVCAVFINQPAVLPESGFVLRASGTELKRDPVPGITARSSLDSGRYLPEEYVKFESESESAIVEIRYRNIVRVDDDAGFLFDSGWYHASTCSNRYGTEIAVGPDGVVSEVNPSGNEQSGNTFIPEGGYVLAAGEGSASERMLQNVSAGDRAEHVKETHLYTVRKMTVTEKTAGAKRPDNALLYLTSDSAAKTPAGSGTDVLVGPDGVILEVLPYSEGGRVIPEGGAAVCASGKYAYPLAEAAKVGELCILSGSKILCLIRNPQTVRNNCETRLAEAKERLAKAETDAAYVNVGQIETLLEQAENVLSETGENEAGRLLEALRLLDECEAELIPSLPLGVRAAWVTIGERDANGQPYLHYRDGESVSRTVSYAKSLNINTLIIDNLATGYAVYPSSVPGLTPHPELNGFDVLQSFSDACLEAGIRLIVMFPALMSFDADATFPEDHYSRIYAGQILKTQTGRTSDGYGASALDPSEPAVRKLIADMVSEIALRYPSLSGIQADYIRYPLPVYYQESNYEDFGYSSPASESFRKERGTDPAALRITDALWEDWCACRRSVVTSLAAEISETARSVNPSLEMSFTCFADARDREIYVLQEPEIWAETGIADAVYPMIYANNTEDQLRYAAGFSDISLHASVVLGVGAYVRATERSMEEQLAMPYELGFAGASVFTLRYISVCGYSEPVKAAWRTETENGPDALLGFLRSRLETLSCLFPDEDLAGIRYRLSEEDPPSSDALLTALEESGVRSERLKTILERDIRYAFSFA